MRFTSPANREHCYRHRHPRRRRRSGTAGLMSRQGLQDHDGAAEPGFGPSSRTGVQTQLALLRTLPCPETHGRIFFSMKHKQKSLLNRFFTQGAGASLGMCMDYRSGKRRPSPSSLYPTWMCRRLSESRFYVDLLEPAGPRWQWSFFFSFPLGHLI